MESFMAVMVRKSKSEKDHLEKEAQLNQNLRACGEKVMSLEIELLETKHTYKPKTTERECYVKVLDVLASAVKIENKELKETLKQLQEEQHPVVEEGTALQDQAKKENTPNQQHSPQVSQPNGSSDTTNQTFNIQNGSVNEEVLETITWCQTPHQETLQVSQHSVNSEESSGKKCQFKRKHLTTQEHQQDLQVSQPSVSSEESVWDTNRRRQTTQVQNGHSSSPGAGLPHSSQSVIPFHHEEFSSLESAWNLRLPCAPEENMWDTSRRRQTTEELQETLQVSQHSVNSEETSGKKCQFKRKHLTTQEHQQDLQVSQPSVSSEESVWDTNKRRQTFAVQNGHSSSAGVGLIYSSQSLAPFHRKEFPSLGSTRNLSLPCTPASFWTPLSGQNSVCQ